MKYFYFASIASYGLLARIVAPFNNKAAQWLSGRKQQLPFIQSMKETWPVIWFHCASYGEFEQCRVIIHKLRKARPDHKILLTFFSPSGYEQVKTEPVADYILYLPEENQRNINDFFNAFNIEIAVFIRYEFWFGYMKAISDRNIPLVFISSSFRRDQIFFKSYGSWFKKQLKHVTYFFVQEENSLKLLNSIQIQNVAISGDTRFDRVLLTQENDEDLQFVKLFTQNVKTIIFGSAWQKETDMFFQLLKELPLDWKVIYAPHEINQDSLNALERKLNVSSVQYSAINKDPTSKVLIVNTIGHLSRMYKYCDVAVVGGGFDDGIHNILEPMVFGLPVYFGPKHRSFWEAQKSIDLGLNQEINTYQDLKRNVDFWISNPIKLQQSRKKSFDFITKGSGANKIVLSYLLSQIK